MSQRDTAAELIDQHGRTYATQAGITLRDKPSPLFCLLVLTMLSSTRISADIAAKSTREVLRLGRTPERLRATTWQQRVDALGRGGYRRYDESTATKLEELADHVIAEHRSDLRRIRPDAHDDVDRMRKAIADVPRIGPTGSEIFAREVQGVWPEVAPYFDTRSLRAARSRGLPDDPRPAGPPRARGPGGGAGRGAGARRPREVRAPLAVAAGHGTTDALRSRDSHAEAMGVGR